MHMSQSQTVPHQFLFLHDSEYWTYKLHSHRTLLTGTEPEPEVMFASVVEAGNQESLCHTVVLHYLVVTTQDTSQKSSETSERY